MFYKLCGPWLVITHVIYHVRLCLVIFFLDFIHLESPLFKVILALTSWPYICLSSQVVLRGNLEYDKTVFLNKVACALGYNYWHIGLSWVAPFVYHYYWLLCNIYLFLFSRYDCHGSVTLQLDTCMFSCHIVEWIAPKYCKLCISLFCA